MALRIVDQAGVTDVGRQRTANEDSLVLAPPFFAVADGMGGARAGEVASALAAGVFGEEADSGEAPEAQLTRIVQEANRRIFELAATDEAHRGMGTTLTAAKVHDDEVSLGHVGDSRAYLLRNGSLEQLTRDHSLVAELERTGQITPEAAEHHPQRSIITRALGPEPSVDVDTYTLAGRDGDLFLICSDGLTSMVPDEELAAILRAPTTLEDTAGALVRAANQSGGKDNITVVLFRLGEADGAASDAPDQTIAGTIAAEEVRAAAETITPASSPAREPAEEPSEITVFGQASPVPAPARRRTRRSRVGLVARVVVGLLVLGAVAGGLYALSRQVYFVATNDGGLVTLYRGVPYELPFGIDLYEQEYASGVPAQAIPAARRSRVLDHSWRSKEDAVDLVRELERGRLDPGPGGS
ncbi:MAG TPA: Stp1/IreP family PP2C-type Ser/Thr phosphatase [Thermoleophilaceae bacterium]|nr:Stp1/IreP family PP2C-type Ser/Thr phosphatase [Thermoleophilaceae bacterium]